MGEIFSQTTVSCLMRIAENSSMPAAMLDQLASHPDPSVREAVADNINTPVDTLWILAADESPDVRYALAENHNIPWAILSSLSEDQNPYVACRARATLERLSNCVGQLITNAWWDEPDENDGEERYFAVS